MIEKCEVICPTFNFGSQYLFSLLISCDEFYFEKYENYQKRSERNKYTIINHRGIQTLSIPLKSGKNNKQLITDVKISYDEDWQKYHLKCISAAYQKAPFYEHYKDQIIQLFRIKYDFLWDFNIEAVNAILTLLKLEKSILFTEAYLKEISDFTIDLRKPYEVSDKIFGFYNQVFEDRLSFIPNVSILDCIFCLGPNSTQYLKGIFHKYYKEKEY